MTKYIIKTWFLNANVKGDDISTLWSYKGWLFSQQSNISPRLGAISGGELFGIIGKDFIYRLIS